MRARKIIKIIGVSILSVILLSSLIVQHFWILEAPISKKTFEEERIEKIYSLEYDEEKRVYKIENTYYLVDTKGNMYLKVVAPSGYQLRMVSRKYMVFDTTYGSVARDGNNTKMENGRFSEIILDDLSLWQRWKLLKCKEEDNN